MLSLKATAMGQAHMTGREKWQVGDRRRTDWSMSKLEDNYGKRRVIHQMFLKSGIMANAMAHQSENQTVLTQIGNVVDDVSGQIVQSETSEYR